VKGPCVFDRCRHIVDISNGFGCYAIGTSSDFSVVHK
jgi:hypothetical protein